jgi:hypothetical protein
MPVAVGCGDFGGDARADVAVMFVGELQCLVTSADLGLDPALVAPGFSAGRSRDVAVGDLDGDGRADVVFEGQDTIAVMLRVQSEGSGPTIIRRAMLRGASQVAVTDYNGDGIPDLLRAGGGVNEVLLGDGSGNFGDEETLDFSGTATKLIVGALEPGVTPDVVGLTELNVLSLWYRTEDGRIGAPLHLGMPGVPLAVRLEDFDEDGGLDIVTVCAHLEPDSVRMVVNRHLGQLLSTPPSDTHTPMRPTIVLRQNPARRSVRFEIALESSGAFKIDLYDIFGRHVHSLEGTHQGGALPLRMSWTPVSDGRSRPQSGVYFYQGDVAGRRFSGKFVLLW